MQMKNVARWMTAAHAMQVILIRHDPQALIHHDHPGIMSAIRAAGIQLQAIAPQTERARSIRIHRRIPVGRAAAILQHDPAAAVIQPAAADRLGHRSGRQAGHQQVLREAAAAAARPVIPQAPAVVPLPLPVRQEEVQALPAAAAAHAAVVRHQVEVAAVVDDARV